MYDLPASPSQLPAPVDRHLHPVDAQTPRLARATDPAVVFASLAETCVPWFSDTCTVEVTELGNTYRVRYPNPTAHDRPPPLPKTYQPIRAGKPLRRSRSSLTLHVDVASVADWPAYAATVTYAWRDRSPTDADAAVGQDLLIRAEGTVLAERQVHRAPEYGPTGRPARSWRLTPG